MGAEFPVLSTSVYLRFSFYYSPGKLESDLEAKLPATESALWASDDPVSTLRVGNKGGIFHAREETLTYHNNHGQEQV